MPRDTSFCLSWLEQIDAIGHAVKSWCKPDPHVTTAGYCTLCCKQVSCANMGIRQILQHAAGSKHTDIATLRFSKNQGHFVKFDKQTNVTETANTVTGVASIDVKTAQAIGSKPAPSTEKCLLKGA